MRRGVIILCGGKSSRIGRDKAGLPFGPETMLQRVVRLVGEALNSGLPADEDSAAAADSQTIVVAAQGQSLPELPAGVTVVRDARPARGPLEGLAAGLRAVADRCDAVYVTGCDVPLLVPAFVQRMFDLLGQHEIAVPCDRERCHPLAAVYRPGVLSRVEQLSAADRLRLLSLLDACETRQVSVADLCVADAELFSLRNINRPEDYEAALAAAGF